MLLNGPETSTKTATKLAFLQPYSDRNDIVIISFFYPDLAIVHSCDSLASNYAVP